MPFITFQRAREVILDAMVRGVKVSRVGNRFTILYCGKCENPPVIELTARYSARHHEKVEPMFVDLHVRCRKCAPCKLAKQLSWRDRAILEYKRWPLTMFGTLTFKPELHYAADAAIVSRLGNADWCSLLAEQQFAERAKALGKHITQWLDIVRNGREAKRSKATRPNFSYLLISEAHDGELTSDEMRGRPHFHILLHDKDNDGRIVLGNPAQAMWTGIDDGEWTKRRYKSGRNWYDGVFLTDNSHLRSKYEFGFTKFQWCDSERSASYLTKYISKALASRVRASQRYGILTELHD